MPHRGRNTRQHERHNERGERTRGGSHSRSACFLSCTENIPARNTMMQCEEVLRRDALNRRRTALQRAWPECCWQNCYSPGRNFPPRCVGSQVVRLAALPPNTTRHSCTNRLHGARLNCHTSIVRTERQEGGGARGQSRCFSPAARGWSPAASRPRARTGRAVCTDANASEARAPRGACNGFAPPPCPPSLLPRGTQRCMALRGNHEASLRGLSHPARRALSLMSRMT